MKNLSVSWTGNQSRLQIHLNNKIRVRVTLKPPSLSHVQHDFYEGTQSILSCIKTHDEDINKYTWHA